MTAHCFIDQYFRPISIKLLDVTYQIGPTTALSTNKPKYVRLTEAKQPLKFLLQARTYPRGQSHKQKHVL